jgi:hypothetical protein
VDSYGYTGGSALLPSDVNAVVVDEKCDAAAGGRMFIAGKGVFTLSVAPCRQQPASTDRIVSNFVARHKATKFHSLRK